MNEKRETILNAVETGKTFLMIGGNRHVRRALLRRFWVETSLCEVAGMDEVLEFEDFKNINERIKRELFEFSRRVTRNHTPTLIWVTRKYQKQAKELDTRRSDALSPCIRSKFTGCSIFTTKIGLTRLLETQMMWHSVRRADEFYPRAYDLSIAEGEIRFLCDFAQLAAINFLRDCGKNLFIYDSVATGANIDAERCEFIQSTIESSLEFLQRQKDLRRLVEANFDFAQYLKRFVLKLEVTIDSMAISKINLNLVLGSKVKFAIKSCLRRYKPLQKSCDGSKNLWILKPAAKSRGRGIRVVSDLNFIARVINNPACCELKDDRYVIQKYIEKPFLIFGTKFDIRQWILVTCWNPLKVWFYRKSYIRFCSQKFDLSNLDRSVHLSNHAVQKNFKIDEERSKNLPKDNIWSCDEFDNYMRSAGHTSREHSSYWRDVLLDQIKALLLDALGAARSTMDEANSTPPRGANFQLFGCDIMLDEAKAPWLIEINAEPSMETDTRVTGLMCPAVLEDTIKVVVDRLEDKDCCTGHFELEKLRKVSCPMFTSKNLKIQGETILTKRRCIPIRSHSYAQVEPRFMKFPKIKETVNVVKATKRMANSQSIKTNLKNDVEKIKMIKMRDRKLKCDEALYLMPNILHRISNSENNLITTIKDYKFGS